jgi:hypothetical protein
VWFTDEEFSQRTLLPVSKKKRIAELYRLDMGRIKAQQWKLE